MSTKGKGKLAYALHAINILPMLLLCMLITLIASNSVSQAMHKEVHESLADVASNVVRILNTAYPGDYRLEGDLALSLYKGQHDLTLNTKLLDDIKADTGLEFTLFYQDTRILTTIKNEEGDRIIGTAAPDMVLEEVLEGGEAQFYDNAIIYSNSFFSYYTPLKNSDGSVVGMLFVGKPTNEVAAAVQQCIIPLVAAVIIVVMIITIFTFLFTKGFVADLLKVRNFLKEVSSGEMNAKLDNSILKRGDELRDIGQSALHMQRSLCSMIEHDTLTQLYNRRYGNRKLKEIIEKNKQSGQPFAIALGDIDYFKKVNDTYGHDCGDMVLKTVSDILRKYMRMHGFVARWGGEEFFFVFDHEDAANAYHILNKVLTEIRCTPTRYGDQVVFVTMTFGITPADTDDISSLLRNADEKLYAGKSGGRNRVVL